MAAVANAFGRRRQQNPITKEQDICDTMSKTDLLGLYIINSSLRTLNYT